MFPPQYYHPVYLLTLTIITCLYALRMQQRPTGFLQSNTNGVGTLLYIVAFIFIVGLRPVSGCFGDTVNYARSYGMCAADNIPLDMSGKEWVFNGLMIACSKVMGVQGFFLIIEAFYILPVLWACKKMVPRHYTLMFLFCMGAFSFFTYGTNGIRNGMACSLMIAALACVLSPLKKDKLIALILCFLAYNCHHSTALPIVCIGAALMIKDIRYCFAFWLFSIVISLVAGGTVESFFTGMGFDDRLKNYATDRGDDAMFSSTGFRWDFLLYSAAPMVLGYYALIKKKIKDRPYSIILGTYILSNSFWVMMIRASYSNRFAYLSWFLYAIVLAYPCLKLPLWKDQGKKAAFILLAHLGFTLFMDLIYWR